MGHIISKDGIVVDIKNIEAIRGWLLYKVYCRVLEDSSPYHFLAKEGEEVLVDRRL